MLDFIAMKGGAAGVDGVDEVRCYWLDCDFMVGLARYEIEQ